MLQGQARGKVGDLVFYVRQGSQQTRVRNRQPANPRTLSTMLQRVKLASVVGFYKRQASFFKFALKKSAKESYYNAFVRYNLNIAPYLTKEQAALGYQIPAPYIISDGDMPQIGVSAVSVDVSNNLDFKTSINSSLGTWGDMRRAYDLMMGDMISIVVFNRGTLPTDATKRVVIQHVFDQQSEAMPIGYDMTGATWDGEGDVWSISIDKSYFGVSEWYAVGAAVVTSRNANGVDCSYAQLALSENAEALYLTFHSDEQHQEAAASYGSEQNAILDPKSFEGNYVDMITLYKNAQHTQAITSITLAAEDSETVYFDKAKAVRWNSISRDLVEGSETIEGVAFDETIGTMQINTAAEAGASGKYILRFLDANGTIVSQAYLEVSTFE